MKILISHTKLKVIFVKPHSDLPGANELNPVMTMPDVKQYETPPIKKLISENTDNA